MRRGTTPTIKCTINGLDLTICDVIWITLKQGTIEITKEKDDLEIVNANNVNIYLSQEETLSFEDNQVQIQLRALIGDKAVASNIQTTNIGRILREGIIA